LKRLGVFTRPHLLCVDVEDPGFNILLFDFVFPAEVLEILWDV